MTGTTVKNTDAILANLTANAGRGAKSAAASGGFQSVWNSQVGKNAPNAAEKSAASLERPEKSSVSGDGAKPEEPLETKDVQKPGKAEQKPVDNSRESSQDTPEEISDDMSKEQLEEAMEALGGAAMELMQKIADTFGISMEELQAAMEDMGMDPLELLEPADLGELILTLGGAKDSLALLTDEKLCDSYKALMEQRNTSMAEAAEVSGLGQEKLTDLLKESLTQGQESVEEATVREPVISVEMGQEKASAVQAELYKTESAEGDAQPEEGLPNEERLQARNPVNESDGADSQKGAGRHSEPKQDDGQNANTNLFAQNLRPVQTEAALQQTQNVAQTTTFGVDTQDIMRQIMDYMKLQLNADTTNLEMQLHPESLGTLHVQVEAKAGIITANFITQNEAVKAALESQIVQLQESFEEQGVKVEAIEVTVQSHAFERNLEQGRGQNQQNSEPSRRARVRRINLNDLSDMEDMEEEDVLAADMLAAGGSTVDYTA